MTDNNTEDKHVCELIGPIAWLLNACAEATAEDPEEIVAALIMESVYPILKTYMMGNDAERYQVLRSFNTTPETLETLGRAVIDAMHTS